MDHVRGYRTRAGKVVGPYVRRSRAAAATPLKSGKRAAVTVAITISAAGLAAIVTISGGFSGGSAALSEQGVSARPASVHSSAEAKAKFSRTRAVFLAAGYGPKLDVRLDSSCAVNSYGSVHRFFLSNPCAWLARASFTLRVGRSSAVLVAISWVDMRTVAQTEQYKQLVDAAGTGNVTELTRESGPYRDVQFNGKNYISGINGTAVWNAEVQPVGSLPAAAVGRILGDSRQ